MQLFKLSCYPLVAYEYTCCVIIALRESNIRLSNHFQVALDMCQLAFRRIYYNVQNIRISKLTL